MLRSALIGKTGLLGVLLLLGGVALGLLASSAVFGHGQIQYRISVQRDGDDIRFRYQDRQGSSDDWATRKIYRASEPRDGVWYYGKHQTLAASDPCPRCPTSTSSSSSGSSSSSSTTGSSTVSGTGTDVKTMRLSAGQHRCTFQLSGNRNSYDRDGRHIAFRLGGRLQVNDIAESGTWTKLVDAGSGGSFHLEAEPGNPSARWTVTCR